MLTTHSGGPSANGGTVVELSGTGFTAALACFLASTPIETAAGPVPVERLAAGDEVVECLGGSGRIVWTGSRVVDIACHPDPDQVRPVRIAADAFGPGQPHQPVFLSPDHAVHVDGVLIPVKHLINGTTVRRIDAGRAEYHHIELEQHGVVLAAGLPAESYLDTGPRDAFSGERVAALHPVFSARSRVHAITGPRVADASIMPRVVAGNTNAPGIMIGEKASAMLLEDAV